MIPGVYSRHVDGIVLFDNYVSEAQHTISHAPFIPPHPGLNLDPHF